MAVDGPVTPSDAASLVVLRGTGERTEVLMGRRRDTARFMPGVYVFPGGATEEQDAEIAECIGSPHRLIATALRETWEETDALIGRPAANITHKDGNAFLEAVNTAGISIPLNQLHYVARAITPAESPIRFDTRFFLCDGAYLHGSPRAVGELPEVVWVPVSRALNSDRVRGVSKFVLEEAVSLMTEQGRLSDPDRTVRNYTYIDGVNVINRELQSDGLI